MKYTKDWFTLNIPTWREVLSAFEGKPCRGLEIGSYEGRSAIWLCENILTHPESRLVCVDVFMAPDSGRAFFSNISESSACEKIEVCRGRSSEVVRRMNDNFDFAYIDGSHTYLDALTDSVLVWPMVRKGGIIIWDDYTHKKYGTGPAIDAFLAGVSGLCEVIHKSHQMIIRRLP